MKIKWLKFCFFVSGLFFMAAIATAAETNKFSIEDTIKDIKPASGMCVPDKVVTVDGQFTSSNYSENIKPDISCALSASELNTALASNKDVVLVDTRKNLDFTSFSIAGAMNTSVSDIKNKAFLRNKRIVLIGDGKAEEDLYLSCAELKKAAFKDVKVLRGGMLAWVSNEYSVNGRVPGLNQLGILTPLELWSESLFAENLIFIDSNQSKFQNKFDKSLLANNITSLDLKKVIEKKRKASKKQNFSSLVIIAANADLNNLAQLRKDLYPIPVLYYFDSFENYEQQLSQQKAVLLARERGPKQPGCHL